MKKLCIGLYGTNGHQIEKLLASHPRAQLVAVAAFGERSIPAECGKVRRYATLEELLANEQVEMVSLCSPRMRTSVVAGLLTLEILKLHVPLPMKVHKVAIVKLNYGHSWDKQKSWLRK